MSKAIQTSLPLRNPFFRDFWREKVRYRFLYGGRASGKSYELGAQLIFLTSTFKLKVLATRYFQNKIAESIYVLLCDIIDKWGYSSIYTITNNSIKCNKTGSEFIFSGLYGKVDELKSIEAIDILVIDEAHSMDEQMWEILIPTIRKEGSEIWCAFNPRSRLDFSWQKFVEHPPGDSKVMKVNYDTNIYLSKTIKKEIEEMEIKDPEKFEHIYLGYPTESSATSLFTYKDVDRAMNRKGSRHGAKVLGLDVASFGDDSTVLSYRYGSAVMWIQKRSKLKQSEIVGWASSVFQSVGADAIVVDSIGVGRGVYERLVDTGVLVIDGNVGFKADNFNTYHNKRAEIYFRLSEAIKGGLEIPDNIELAQELLATEYEHTESGRAKIVKKDQIKELLGRSPDIADSIALTYFWKRFGVSNDTQYRDRSETKISNLY